MSALILALMLMQNANSDPSLFSATASNLFLFRDLKARNVGDILTIQVVESASATNSANTATQKDGSAGLSAPALGGLEKGASMLNFANILQASGNTSFKRRFRRGSWRFFPMGISASKARRRSRSTVNARS